LLTLTQILTNKEKARMIVQNLPMTADQVNNYLNKYPDIQIEIFENLLKEEKYRPSNRIEDRIKLKYIELKC
jgi:hypothetical protein